MELSPFVVEASEDEGYSAKESLASTRVRTELKDVGSAISVITQKFLKDTNSKNSADLLVYTTGTEVAAQGGNFVGRGDGAYIDSTSYTQPVSNTRVRGLAEADNLRDFFLTDIPWDSYNVGRVDLQRGANSVLFGIGSPAGIVNSSINTASFKDGNRVELQFSDLGSQRATADLNKVFLKGELAVRVATLWDHTKYKQKPAFRDDERIFAALRWDPKFMRTDTARTSFRVNYERGSVDANYPRLTPPMDAITPWFSQMNKTTFDMLNNNELTTFGNARYNPWLGAAGSRIWDGVVVTYANPASAQQGYAFPASPDNFPTPPSGEAFRNNPQNGSYKGIQVYNNYAFNARLPGYAIQPFKTKSLTDASIFDFYNNLMEGENKSNWNKFDALNLNASQTFFNNKLGLEIAYDKQHSQWGYRNAMASDAASITVDVMNQNIDGTPNPNVGRAMVILGGGSAGSGSTDRHRTASRATVFGELNFNDIFKGNETLGGIFGRHVLTGTIARMDNKTLSRNWVNWYLGANYAPVGYVGDGPKGTSSVGQASRDIVPLTYLSSGSLKGLSSASGLNLPRITAYQVPLSTTLKQWDTRTMSFVNWNVPIINPNSTAYTDATRPYTNLRLTKDIIDSKVAVWQAYLFNGHLVPMIGVRSDDSENFDAGTPGKTLGIVTNNNDGNWRLPTGAGDTAGGRSYASVSGNTRTYSIVGHMPKSIMKNLPGNMGLSAFYNKSENFKPDASRKDILGMPISAPTGKTKDYGVTISALDQRVILKINRYETSVTAATLSGELGNAYLIGAGEAWGQQAAYQLSINSGNWPGDGNYGLTSAASSYGAGNILRWQPADTGLVNPALGYNAMTNPYTQAAIDAQYAIQRASTADWLAKPVPQSFQQAWGMTGYATGSGQWSMNSVVVTGDTSSKGTEYELIANPIKGLDISFNASKTDARRLNIGKAYSDWIEKRYQDYKGPMGDMRLWGNGNWALQKGAGGTVRDKFEQETLPNYKLALALNGSNVPELRPWRFNATVNYSFQNDMLKGTNVGGSMRWSDAQVTGFKLNSTLDGYDVNNPIMGENDTIFDLWIGHERKLTSKLKWRVQLNIRNVFASKDLIPVTRQPDGSAGIYRIPEPRVISISNALEF